MGIDINYPKITSDSDKGKLEQIRAYLYQLADQLKWALNSLEDKVSESAIQSYTSAKTGQEEDAQTTFSSIKALIIKSADIVNAYSEEIKNKLSGGFVAKSDFGIFEEQTEQSIIENSKEIDRAFRNIQQITTDITKIIDVTAHIKVGLLSNENEVPIYGVEVGQINEIDGKEVFNKYARFTSDRLSFYDKNDTEVAYISDYKLYITNAHISGSLTLGRFEMDTSNGLVIKWV
jgi:hypothetical protein